MIYVLRGNIIKQKQIYSILNQDNVINFKLYYHIVSFYHFVINFIKISYQLQLISSVKSLLKRLNQITKLKIL